MYLFFFDGSGNTGADLTHPTITINYLVGLAIDSDQARPLEDAVTATLEGRFGSACHASGFECKGSDMYRGEGPCAAMTPADRIALYQCMVDLLPRFGVQVIWHGIHKPGLAARYPKPIHPHKLAFLFFGEDVERFLRAKRKYGLLVSDEEKSVEQQVIEDLPRYKQLGTGFGHKPIDLTRIIDNVHWVKSPQQPPASACGQLRVPVPAVSAGQRQEYPVSAGSEAPLGYGGEAGVAGQNLALEYTCAAGAFAWGSTRAVPTPGCASTCT